MCKTIWSDTETWEEYTERVRVYDPTATTFKRIHFALLFGHGVECENEFDNTGTRYRKRPAPSQQNIIHGQAVSVMYRISYYFSHTLPAKQSPY